MLNPVVCVYNRTPKERLNWKSPYEPFFTACQPPASHQLQTNYFHVGPQCHVSFSVITAFPKIRKHEDANDWWSILGLKIFINWTDLGNPFAQKTRRCITSTRSLTLLDTSSSYIRSFDRRSTTTRTQLKSCLLLWHMDRAFIQSIGFEFSHACRWSSYLHIACNRPSFQAQSNPTIYYIMT